MQRPKPNQQAATPAGAWGQQQQQQQQASSPPSSGLNPAHQYPLRSMYNLPAVQHHQAVGGEGYYALIHLPEYNTFLAGGDSTITWFDLGLKTCTTR